MTCDRSLIKIRLKQFIFRFNNMKVLVLNCGSSSIKFKLIDMPANVVLESGGIEKLGLPDSFLKYKKGEGAKAQIDKSIPTHLEGIHLILDVLTGKETGVISSLNEIDAVGHRVVHGGEKFASSVLITPDVIKQIEDCKKLAPLHNAPNLTGIEAISKLLPSVPQVAVFDTAFHQSIPEKAFMYALPYELYKNDGIRRYGFHGTSHRFVSGRAIELMGGKKGLKMITCHIGNGGSISAINDGKSVDTSMGLTPLEGLMMGTRCGDIDPAVVSFLMDAKGWSAKEVSDVMNKKSGLAGLSGVSSDMRDVVAAVKSGNKQATMAYDVFNYRIKKYIGAYTAALGGLDVLVFTGGMGENEAPVRKAICENMEYLGIKLDESKNEGMREEGVISTDDSHVKVFVIPTDEEYMIALDTLNIVGK